ncbi:LamG domain-containing protein [Roseateles sp. DAIF2]|uniref:LamG domain-containing protein n=1 Tax=Roseateles sp. DAIF2 TaxID=2714952 RepID=UPI0018A2A9F4|nr:LamG domain-containing protein [Roseateles sp. DAIF2]QPF74188.1 LamG domain-containing protein [Roseateles sp. DAIF2]
MSLLQDISPAGGIWNAPYQTLDTVNTLFGAPSLSFNGVDRFWSQGSNRVEHQLHSGDFVIDGFARFEGLGPGYGLAAILGKAASGNQSYYLAVSGDGSLIFYFSTNGSGGGLIGVAGAAPVGSFYHFEVGRAGNTFYLFINGVLKGTTNYSGSFFNSGEPLNIGRINVGSYEFYFKGQLRELRIKKGVAPHTAGFAPPTAPPAAGAADPTFANTVLFTRGDALLINSSTKALGAFKGAGTPMPTAAPKATRGPRHARDTYHGGRGIIIGTVYTKGTPNTPVQRRVRLMRDRDSVVIRETWSNPATGAYAFPLIDENQKYTVIALDHTNDKRAAIADNLTPDLMP